MSTTLALTILTASWKSHLVSTHRWTVSTPLVASLRTCFWDRQPVSTHRWTVSTPLTKCVDTQPDYVDTTGFNCSDCFLGQSSSVDTQVDCVDTTMTNLCKPENIKCKPLIKDIIIKM
ncbi:hypothetical protein Taro_023567 [Colocasia esculenta]|uniref:Uncharacterized protein n=1 Tax=Colocasia esculenta TaxID=4460 RepID=A0A843V512_COLES|nr:hypothetical protein [Colocasia esculenta]